MTSNSPRQIELCTLATVESAEIRGGMISGRWKPEAQRERIFSRSSGELAQEFVNTPSDAAAIRKFTLKFGPLKPPDRKHFRFAIRRWQEIQQSFRRLWESAVGTTRVHLVMDVSPGDELIYDNRVFIFQAASLERLLYLDLFTCPPERLRCCKSPEPNCPEHYFVARKHLGQEYCSDLCSNWARNRYKREWWRKHGEQWRAQQSLRKEK